MGYDSRSKCCEVTGRGADPSGPRAKSIECGRASWGRWVLFLAGWLGLRHGGGNPPPGFPRERILWSGVWRCRDGVCRQAGSLAAAGFIAEGEHITRRQASRYLYARRSSIGGRQASTARMLVGVQEKQFVNHLGTRCQKADSFLVM